MSNFSFTLLLYLFYLCPNFLPLFPLQEIPLPPCLSEGPGFLNAQQWAEPVRERNKDWQLASYREALNKPRFPRRLLDMVQDSRHDLLSGEMGTQDGRHKYHTFRAPEKASKSLCQSQNDTPIHKYIFERWENVPPSKRFAKQEKKRLRWQDNTLMNHELLWRHGVSVGEHYGILSAWGNGISGRIYGEGLHISRFVVLEFYIPSTCWRKRIKVTMRHFETLFASSKLEPLLRGGRKDVLINTLAKMLVLEKVKYLGLDNGGQCKDEGNGL